MKNIIKFLAIILIAFSLIGCASRRKVIDAVHLGSSMKYSLVIENGSMYQIDSLINADTLPVLEKWITTTFIDSTTSKGVVKRMCIKRNDRQEYIYIISGNTEPYQIIKRIKE